MLEKDEMTRTKVQNYFNVNKTTIQRDVGIIKEWAKQQLHLPEEIQDEDFIEKCLVRNEFHVEQSKQNLETYCRMKPAFLETIRNVSAILPSESVIQILTIPGLNDKLETVSILRLNSSSVNEEDFMKYLRHMLCWAEYSLRTHYGLGHRIIYDCNNVTAGFITKFGTKIPVFGNFFSETYAIPIAGIEVTNLSSFSYTFLSSWKKTVESEIFDKVLIHKDLQSLHNNVNKRYLPKDYGGDLLSFDDLILGMDQEFSLNAEKIEAALFKTVSKEDLRVADLKLNENFGASGTFKQLNID